MTRKDFQLIADAVKETRRLDQYQNYPEILDVVSEKLASKLTSTNAAFKRERFLCACGHTEYTR